MRAVEAEVFLVQRPGLDYDAIAAYLQVVHGESWLERLFNSALDPESQGYDPTSPEVLAEFAGKLCYRAWEPGLNPNVSRTRSDHKQYLENILAQAHGSVLEHATFSFVLHNVSRVLTHELVRHRPGVAISQESMRYVRLTDIPFWFPEWARQDDELMHRATGLLADLEAFQEWMAAWFGLDDASVPFSEKKHKTSFMRRFAPDGVSTAMLWTANIRTLRHVIEARTAPGAEEEIRHVFGMIAELCLAEAPALFGDYTIEDGAWVPKWRKV